MLSCCTLDILLLWTFGRIETRGGGFWFSLLVQANGFKKLLMKKKLIYIYLIKHYDHPHTKESKLVVNVLGVVQLHIERNNTQGPAKALCH